MRLRHVSIALVAAALLAATAACSSGPTGGSSSPSSSSASAGAGTGVEKGAYPVSVTDSFATTTIESEPKRIATVGWGDQDTAVALGVVPVGATKITYGGNANGSTSWFDAELKKVGGAQPTRYDDSDGVPFDDIAKLSPDLILATSSGITKSDYAKLSKIAPVVAWKGAPFGTPWQTQTELIGAALGRPAQAKELVEETEDKVADFAEEHPALAGKTGAVAYFDTKDTSQIGFYLAHDLRPQILTEMGMRTPPVVEKLSAGNAEFYKTISSERAPTVDAQVIVTYDDPEGTREKVLANDLFAQIPAIKSGAIVFMDDRADSLSMSLPSVLAMPWFLRTIAPQIADAAAKAS